MLTHSAVLILTQAVSDSYPSSVCSV